MEEFVVIMLLVLFGLNVISIWYYCMVYRKFVRLESDINLIISRLNSISSDVGHVVWIVDGLEHTLDNEFNKQSALEKNVCEPEKEKVPCPDDIHMITFNEFEFDYSVGTKRYLCYYADSEKLFCYDKELKNVYEIVGPALSYFGYNREDENTVYVRNHRYNADICITKEKGEGPDMGELVVEDVTESCYIVHIGSHYEVCINGKFYCSADTISEACKDVEEYFKSKEKEGEMKDESEGSESAGEVAEERVEEETVI